MGQVRRKLLADRRIALGMKQDELAANLGIERSTVVRWEAGKTTPQPWVRPKLADALQVSSNQLDDLLTLDAEGESAHVDRRAFNGLATAIALAPLARSKHGSQIGETEVRQLRARTARLRRLDDHLGGMDTYQVYTTEMAATARLVKQASYSQSTARALTGVLAEQAQMAGWAAFDAGRMTESRKHYKTALNAATESGDAALIGNSLAFMAYERADIQTAAQSTHIAGGRVTPRVNALLHERLAWTYAVAGQANATRQALDLATAAVHETSSDEVEPDWVFWVDDTEIDIMSGRCWSELGRPDRAIPVLQSAMARYDDTHSRDKALYLTWLAHAHIDADEPAQAAAVCQRALDLAAGVGSVRPGERIQGVLRRLIHFGDPDVKAVLDRARG